MPPPVANGGAAKEKKGGADGGGRGRARPRSTSRDRNLANAETAGDESSELSASDEDSAWISWFTSLRGNEFFCEVLAVGRVPPFQAPRA